MLNKKYNSLPYVVTILVLIAVIVFSFASHSAIAARTVDFFKKSGDNIILTNALYEIGASGNRVAKIWATAIDTTNITIGGASLAALDMGGFAITNGGTFTMTNVVSTSTTANSSFANNLGVGTTSPSQILHVFSDAAPTTTSEFGDIGSSTAKTCFNVNATDGSAASFYFNTSGIVFETNACK